MRDSPSPSPSLDEAQMSSNHSSSVSSSPSHTERTAETTRTYLPQCSALSRKKDALALTCLCMSTLYFHWYFRPAGQRAVVESQCAGTFPWSGAGSQGLGWDFSGTQQGEQEEPRWQRFVWWRSAPGVAFCDFESHLYLMFRGCQSYLDIIFIYFKINVDALMPVSASRCFLRISTVIYHWMIIKE